MAMTLGELAARLGGELHGDAARQVESIASLLHAEARAVTFLANASYKKDLARTRAGAVLLRADDADACPVAAIVVADPYVAYAKVTQWLYPSPVHEGGIHPSAVVAASARIDAQAWVGANCVVGERAEIGARAQLGPGCVVGDDARVGADTRLHANVTIYHACEIGQRVIIHSGAVIGSDGFGFANEKGRWVKIMQIGRVLIGDDVEIGANVALDRGALEDTVIEEGAKLDNLVHLAHNVHIGAHSALAAQVGFAGSTHVGRHCAFGGQAGIVGHIEICDNAVILGKTSVTKSIDKSDTYSSVIPAMPHNEWNKTLVRLRRLEQLEQRVKQLEQQLDNKKA